MWPLRSGVVLLASFCVIVVAVALAPPSVATASVSGGVYAWGDNSFGELGDGTTTQHDSPEAVTLATSVTATAVSAGATFSLAIGSDGNLYAWGSNTVGQLGDGTTTSHKSPEVVTLAAGVKPTAISAGGLNSLAIGSDGKLYAWGDNTNGELGDGTTTQHDSPEAVTLATGVTATAVSAATASDGGLAIGSDGNLYAWGDNTDGQLGDGTTTVHKSPEMVTLAAGVKPTAISAGALDSLAIGSDGKLYGWGYNGNADLGDGTTTDQHAPEVITIAAGVTPAVISAGTDSSLAIGSDGKLYAWGSNTYGELGDGTTTGHKSPEVITLATGVKPAAISASGFDSMAIGSDNNLYAWGSNSATINGTLATFGELGDGTTTTHASPEVITLAAGVVPVAVSAGLVDTLAIGATCSASAAPTCPPTPSPTTSSPTPTTSHTHRSHDTDEGSGDTDDTSADTDTAETSATPSTSTPSTSAAPATTPAGVAAAVQATGGVPLGAPETGGGSGPGINGVVVAVGVAFIAAGTGLVVLARRRGRRRPPV